MGNNTHITKKLTLGKFLLTHISHRRVICDLKSAQDTL